MRKAILLSLVLILLVFAGCKEQETTTVYVEPEQTSVQENVVTIQEGTSDEKTETKNEKTSDVDVGEGTESDDLDLSDYPSPFIKSGKLNAYVIVGAKASSLEVVAATEILSGLEFEERVGSYYPDALDKDFDSIAGKNAILIGNPCNNRFIAALMPYETNCIEDFDSGKAIIKLYKTGDSTYALVVGGYSGQDTRRAAQYLGRYKSKDMKGTEMSV